MTPNRDYPRPVQRPVDADEDRGPEMLASLALVGFVVLVACTVAAFALGVL